MGDVPERKFMDDPETEWKTTRPDYSVVNKLFLEGRSRNHAEDSLEKLVENLVKTWEMESTHKVNRKDWRSVDKDEFWIRVNGKKSFNLDDNIKMGNYNMLLTECPLYDPEAETNASSHELFRSALPRGFAWEVTEVYSGPPTVTFKWRHWGYWEGDYKNRKGRGQMLELFGMCVVGVTSDLLVQYIDVYYDPSEFLSTLVNFDRKSLCPFDRK